MTLLFIAGLLTGFHCLSMCGNLVIGYSLRNNKTITYANHIVYNAFRLLSYVLTGAVLGLLGKVLNIAAFGGTATIAAGIFMVFLGLKMLGIFASVNIPKLPGTKFVKDFFAESVGKIRHLTNKTKVAYLPEATLGSISGVMPCAPLQAAQIYAAGTGSPFEGALAMLVFGAGTIPMLFLYGLVAGKISQSFKNKLAYAMAVIVLLLGLVMLNRGLILTGAPVSAAKVTGLVAQAFNKEDSSPASTEVSMKIERTQYIPSIIRVPAGKPATLTIFRNEDGVCSEEIVFPEIGIRKKLTPYSETLVKIPPLKAGSYQITCQMGMMSGTLVVGEGSGSSKVILGIMILLAGLVGTAVGLRMKKKESRNINERVNCDEST